MWDSKGRLSRRTSGIRIVWGDNDANDTRISSDSGLWVWSCTGKPPAWDDGWWRLYEKCRWAQHWMWSEGLWGQTCHHPTTVVLVATYSWNVPLGWQRACPITQQHPPSPPTLSTPAFPINMPPGWPRPLPSLYNPTVNWSVETNGEELPASEDAAGAVLSKATSHLSSPALSHPPPPPPAATPEPRPPSPRGGGGGGGALQGLLCYQRAPALKWAGPESGLCLLEGISLVVRVSPR